MIREARTVVPDSRFQPGGEAMHRTGVALAAGRPGWAGSREMALTQQSPGTILGLVALALAGALLAMAWPVAAVGLAATVLLCAVALRAPALGLVGGLLIAGSEGLSRRG